MIHSLKQMLQVAQVSLLQTSSAPRKPLASEGQEAKPESKKTFRSYRPLFMDYFIKNKGKKHYF